MPITESTGWTLVAVGGVVGGIFILSVTGCLIYVGVLEIQLRRRYIGQFKPRTVQELEQALEVVR
ncbi:hypothetical protein AbraIFM66950_004527 [Aspergillus brasiliensis]|nr:hypothetical protein AbraIFM66950_004527 [Aspergillus brasiliensis]